MHLAVGGHPLHTRALSVTLAQRADGRLDAHGTILDLRKRGFVPIAGDLQACGVIHDMRLDGIVDPETSVLAAVAADQRSVAFEPSATTRGESCRDPIDRIAGLAGGRLDDGWSRRVADQIGGPRGCSHLLTLAYLLGATTAWALPRARALSAGTATHRPGERVLRRDVVLDGHEPVPGRLQLAAQLSELLFAPASALAAPMARFAAQHEVRLLVELEFPTLEITAVSAAERARGLDDLAEARWDDRDTALAWLVGSRLGSGTAGQLLARLDAGPLRDTALMLAPALIQCVAALSEGWAIAARAAPSVVGIGGLPDSCYMWRRDGALLRAREAEGGSAPPRP